MKKIAIKHITTLAILIIALYSLPAYATPEYSDRTGQGCMTCHISNEGGGRLTTKGLEFAASGYKWPPEGGYRVLGPIRKSVRLGIGLLHVTSSFIWFGAILYVHILLRPGYASRGLPKAEVALGLASMTAVGLTGILLTISRIRSADVLFMSHWGNVLLIKICLYIIMLSSALFTILFVGAKLKRACVKACIPQNNIFDPVTLSAFDGKNGAPAYVSCKGKVYDVSMLKLWKDGVHMKHLAGGDLTYAIAKSPHGEGKLEKLSIVGTYDAALTPQKTFAQKAFYFIAYMNLFLVFVVLFVIAYWRWGL
jgi:predicted heme/steroid binding protein